MPVGKLLVIDTEAMQHGRVEVMDVHGLVDNVIAKIIGFTVDNDLASPHHQPSIWCSNGDGGPVRS